MMRKKRPSGRDSLVAGATLEAMTGRETRVREVEELTAYIPGARAWSGVQRGAIRLINLERRARFARLSAEMN